MIALAFDLFGTVFDWRGSIEAEGRRITGDRPGIDWPGLAGAWSRAYGRAVADLGGTWAPLDRLLSGAFPALASRFGLDLGPAEAAELAGTWSRLRPWPDAAEALERLAGRFRLVAFSNANHAMIEALCDASALPWSDLVSTEFAHAFKPDPRCYQALLSRLGSPASRVMLVASHCFDLNAAKLAGIHTALVTRPGEPGTEPADLDHTADIIAGDLGGFADHMLGADSPYLRPRRIASALR